MKIRRITIEGFRSFGPTPFVWSPDDGVTAIVGHNGAGKSSLLNAIKYAFYGDDAYPGVKQEELVNVASSEARVSVRVEIQPQHFLDLTRTAKLSVNRVIADLVVGLESPTGNANMTKGTIAESQAKVLEYIPSLSVLENTTFISQGQVEAFMNMKPAEQRDTISLMLQPPAKAEVLYKIAQSHAKDLGDSRRDKDTLITDLEMQISNMIGSLPDDEEIQDTTENWIKADRIYERDVLIFAEETDLYRKLSERWSAASEVHKESARQVTEYNSNSMALWQGRVSELSEGVSTLNRELLKINETVTESIRLEAVIRTDAEKLASFTLQGNLCPLCKQNLESDEAISHVVSEKVTIEARMKRAHAELEAIEIEGVLTDQAITKNLIHEGTERRDRFSATKPDQKSAPVAPIPLKPLRTAPIAPFKPEILSTISDTRSRLEKMQTRVRELTQDKWALEKEMLLYEVVTDCLSPTGWRQLMIDSALGNVEARTNQWLESFMPGHTIALSTLSETGKERLTVDFGTPRGVRTWHTFSGGERAVLGLAVNMGFAEVAYESMGMHADMIVLDEADAALVERNQEQFLLAVGQLEKAGKQVFMISHIADVKERASNVLELVNNGGTTRA